MSGALGETAGFSNYRKEVGEAMIGTVFWPVTN